MKEFWKVIKKYVRPYVGYLGGSVLLNILSAVFNVFSFSLLIPILKILFDSSAAAYTFIPWDQVHNFGDLTNNAYFYVGRLIGVYGQSKVLLGLCLTFCVITLVKTSCYFGSSAVMTSDGFSSTLVSDSFTAVPPGCASSSGFRPRFL